MSFTIQTEKNIIATGVLYESKKNTKKNKTTSGTIGFELESQLSSAKCVDVEQEFFIEFIFPETFLFFNEEKEKIIKILYKDNLLAAISLKKEKWIEIEENQTFILVPDRYFEQVRVYLDTRERVLIFRILAVYLLQWLNQSSNEKTSTP